MFETLYKTDRPELRKSKCYELSLHALPGTGPRTYAIREVHGWWDESMKTFIHHVTTLNTSEEGVTFEEAQAMYMKARESRVRSGFVHSFSPNYYGDKPYEYRHL